MIDDKRTAPTGAPIACTLDEARLIAVAAQRLDRRPIRRGPVSKESIRETIQTLGCVQLDAISVVARSHETVLWSRLGAYDPGLLAALHHPDGDLFEYWGHAAALLPIAAFPYYRRNMARYVGPDSPYAAWIDEHAATLELVLTSIRERGPLSSRAFERPDGPRSEPWSWWGGKPAREALNLLWTRGDLMVQRRDGFERYFDLTERILPGAHEAELPTDADQRRYFVSGALRALGVATPRWVADYFRTGGRPHVPAREAASELARMAEEGLAVPVTVPGIDEPVWLDAAQRSRLEELRAGRGRPTLTTFLSPFDNLIWRRDRALKLFGFHYLLEIYIPAPKRRYGYYTLPILHRSRLVGRLDPSYSRKERVLTIKSIHLEPRVRPTDSLLAAIAKALLDYGAFLGGTEVLVLTSDPPSVASSLTNALRAAGSPRNDQPALGDL